MANCPSYPEQFKLSDTVVSSRRCFADIFQRPPRGRPAAVAGSLSSCSGTTTEVGLRRLPGVVLPRRFGAVAIRRLGPCAGGVGPQFGRPAGCCGALCKETRPGSADICHSKGSAHRLDGIGKKDLFCATPLQRGASAKPESSRRDRRTSPCGRRWKSCLLAWRFHLRALLPGLGRFVLGFLVYLRSVLQPDSCEALRGLQLQAAPEAALRAVPPRA